MKKTIIIISLIALGGCTTAWKPIVDVRVSEDPKVLTTLKTQLDRLNAIGGLKSVVPSEGITFVYKGKLYKYTGAFAPANQILGMLKFV